MTTKEAAKRYELEHLLKYHGRSVAIHNPHEKPLEELPVIYGFNNGGRIDWLEAVLLAEDGTCLGGHICSSEAYMPADLGILEDTRPDRHETFREHYPDGYRMEFIPSENIREHAGLKLAIERYDQQNPKESS